MTFLSKSKLLAYRQCAKRLWLQVHKPELAEVAEGTEARFRVGHEVGEVARGIYDPLGAGTLVDVEAQGFDKAFSETQALIKGDSPIFEGGFRAEGALAFADILLPVGEGGKRKWRIVEVKSSTSVKGYHLEDVAIQNFVARASGVPLAGIAIAHIDSKWTYPGDEDYSGLLVEQDLTAETLGLEAEVPAWISGAQAVVKQKTEPAIGTDSYCTDPFECPFLQYCRDQEPRAEVPLDVLPDVRTKKLKEYVESHPAGELSNVPDELLNERQARVKQATLSGNVIFDPVGAAAALRIHKLPAYFMDFETIQFAVPIWKGTRPYQQIPFQFSVHWLGSGGALTHQEFLDLSGQDPCRGFSEALIQACGDQGPVFVFNATFEKTRIRELAERFPDLAGRLWDISNRIVDLLPVARDHYYHPNQQGSWSIKDIVNAAFEDLSYDKLDGVQDGGMAMEAFVEALAPETSEERKAQLQTELLAYCKLDTYGMVRLWGMLSGNAVG